MKKSYCWLFVDFRYTFLSLVKDRTEQYFPLIALHINFAQFIFTLWVEGYDFGISAGGWLQQLVDLLSTVFCTFF